METNGKSQLGKHRDNHKRSQKPKVSKELLMMNSRIKEYRTLSDKEIIKDFKKAYKRDKKLAMKALFYWGDTRNGLGERRLFKVILKYLAKENPKMVERLVEYIPEYTRWDNLWVLLDTPVKDKVIKLINRQLSSDIVNMSSNKPISLCAKWLPSINTSSAATRKNAKIIISELHIKEKNYRKSLSLLRRYLNIVECKISRNEWDKIDYKNVPSSASKRYDAAFKKHDDYRRSQYLAKTEREEKYLKKISQEKKKHISFEKAINSDRYKLLEKAIPLL